MRPLTSAKRKAFTLIELIVVIVILGILASVATVGYNSVISRSSTEAARAEANSFEREVRALLAFSANGTITQTDVTEAVLAAQPDLEDQGAINFLHNENDVNDPNDDEVTFNSSNGSSVLIEFSGSQAPGVVIVDGTTASVGGSAPPPPPLSATFNDAEFDLAGSSEVLAVSAQDGSGTYTYSYTGALPTGVTFDGATGEFAGPSAFNQQFADIEASFAHMCGLTNAGAVYCWGDNYYGQLGNGTNTNSNLPVLAISSGASMIATAAYSSCAAMTAGGIKCWGANYYGQLGDGTNTESWTPVDVSGYPHVVHALAASLQNVCAAYDNSANAPGETGVMHCWGDNNGVLIQGNNAIGLGVPAQNAPYASNMTDILELEGGQHQTMCSIRTSGAGCWGNSDYYQAWDGSGMSRADYMNANQHWNIEVAEWALGQWHTCALLSDTSPQNPGDIWCAGRNGNGQWGNGSSNGYGTQPALVRTAAGTKIWSTEGRVCYQEPAGVFCAGGFDGYSGFGAASDGWWNYAADLAGYEGGYGDVLDIAQSYWNAAVVIYEGGAIVQAGNTNYCLILDATCSSGSVSTSQALTYPGSGFGVNTGFPAALVVTIDDGTEQVDLNITLTLD